MDLIWHDRTELEIGWSDLELPRTDSWDATIPRPIVRAEAVTLPPPSSSIQGMGRTGPGLDEAAGGSPFHSLALLTDGHQLS